MPCRVDDWDDVARVTKQYGMDIHDFEAVLCGIFTVMEHRRDERDDWLGDIHWSEVGVPREMVEKWWEGHKREDAKRRKAEAAKRRKEELKAQARSKLTKEERTALGI